MKGKADKGRDLTIRTFRDLVVWQDSMQLVREVYRITEAMPDSERFGLTNQMRRAAVSIPSNIAEGHSRHGTRDYLKHLKIARGSLSELSTQYELTCSLGMIQPDHVSQNSIDQVDRLLQGLIRALDRKLKPSL